MRLPLPVPAVPIVLACTLLAACMGGAVPPSPSGQAVQAPSAADAGTIAAWAAGAHRRPANVARDPHRHPVQTLDFFGVRPDDVVVEILPGSAGYYLEILAPWLRERGRYVAAGRDASAPPAYLADHAKLLERLVAEPRLYDRVAVTPFNADRHALAPPGSVDVVLTFRNLHNWIERGEVDAVLRTIHAALKPGGVLGVVDHRARPDLPEAAQLKAGYVREASAIAMIERAGFRLVAASEVNANPRDTREHPEGVWTLPPTYRLKDRDRARYAAIGESDRFTLKFVKR